MRRLLTLPALPLAGPDLADPSLDEMPPVDPEPAILHIVPVDITTPDHATESECAARLAAARLYTSTIPEELSFTRCAESRQ